MKNRNGKMITFTYHGNQYTVDPYGYADPGSDHDCYFPVRQCPNCKTVNHPHDGVCKKCNHGISGLEPVLAVRKNSTGKMIAISAAIWAFISAIAGLLRIKMGAIPVFILSGIAISIGKACSKDQICVDETATRDYQAYCAELQEGIKENGQA